MTTDKLKTVFRLYADCLVGAGASGNPDSNNPTEDNHLLYMCNTALLALIPSGKIEKAMRWLGFVQGCLVSRGIFDLEDVKGHSRPDEEGEENYRETSKSISD